MRDKKEIAWLLKERQKLPVHHKVEMTRQRIHDFHKQHGGDVAIDLSGGKDSTLLATIGRDMLPDIPLIFSNTGMEYPEILEFVKTWNNVAWVRPKISFYQVIKKYGYPIISKEVANKIYRLRNTKSPYEIRKILKGCTKTGKPSKTSRLADKHVHLINAPFLISDKCCYHMKKAPMKAMKTHHMDATMAVDSMSRRIKYLRQGGCTSVDGSASTPMAFWTEQDVLQYLHNENIEIAKVYGEIEHNGSKYYTTKENRTGCMWCMFGVHMEKGGDRFSRMKITHPKQYDYCMKKLDMRIPLKYARRG